MLETLLVKGAADSMMAHLDVAELPLKDWVPIWRVLLVLLLLLYDPGSIQESRAIGAP